MLNTQLSSHSTYNNQKRELSWKQKTTATVYVTGCGKRKSRQGYYTAVWTQWGKLFITSVLNDIYGKGSFIYIK